MSKIWQITHSRCKIKNKSYFLTIKYNWERQPIELVLKERKTGKIVHKVVYNKHGAETKIKFEEFEKIFLKIENFDD